MSSFEKFSEISFGTAVHPTEFRFSHVSTDARSNRNDRFRSDRAKSGLANGEF